jgi:hypothetical protein
MISRLYGYLAAAGGVLAFIAAIFLKGKSEGRADEQARQTEQTLDDVTTHKEIADDVGSLSDAELDARNAPWVRLSGGR